MQCQVGESAHRGSAGVHHGGDAYIHAVSRSRQRVRPRATTGRPALAHDLCFDRPVETRRSSISTATASFRTPGTTMWAPWRRCGLANGRQVAIGRGSVSACSVSACGATHTRADVWIRRAPTAQRRASTVTDNPLSPAGRLLSPQGLPPWRPRGWWPRDDRGEGTAKRPAAPDTSGRLPQTKRNTAPPCVSATRAHTHRARFGTWSTPTRRAR